MPIEYDARITRGDVVTLDQHGNFPRAGSYGGHYRFDEGTVLRVTRVGSERLIVRGIPQVYQDTQEEVSVFVHRANLTLIDEATPIPVRRPLGQKPEDTEDMTYLSPDDPRLRWLWEDAAKYANSKRFCGEYDAICAVLNIPGRPRDFTVVRTFEGIRVEATINAVSQAAAEQTFNEALAASYVTAD
jgi:hypothetical protein